jgi:hypothetical protein
MKNLLFALLLFGCATPKQTTELCIGCGDSDGGGTFHIIKNRAGSPYDTFPMGSFKVFDHVWFGDSLKTAPRMKIYLGDSAEYNDSSIYFNYNYEAKHHTDSVYYDTVYGAVFTIYKHMELKPNADTSAFKIINFPVKYGEYGYAVYEVRAYNGLCRGHSSNYDFYHKGWCDQQERKLIKIISDNDELHDYFKLVDLTKWFEFIPDEKL